MPFHTVYRTKHTNNIPTYILTQVEISFHGNDDDITNNYRTYSRYRDEYIYSYIKIVIYSGPIYFRYGSGKNLMKQLKWKVFFRCVHICEASSYCYSVRYRDV